MISVQEVPIFEYIVRMFSYNIPTMKYVLIKSVQTNMLSVCYFSTKLSQYIIFKKKTIHEPIKYFSWEDITSASFIWEVTCLSFMQFLWPTFKHDSTWSTRNENTCSYSVLYISNRVCQPFMEVNKVIRITKSNRNGIITSPGHPGHYPNSVCYIWDLETGFLQANIYFLLKVWTFFKTNYAQFAGDYWELSILYKKNSYRFQLLWTFLSQVCVVSEVYRHYFHF